MTLIIPRTKQEKDGTYTLLESASGMTPVKGHNIDTDYCTLLPNGQLIRKVGFNSNGPSGGAINTVNSLEPAGEHDCFYKLIMEGHLPLECKKPSDKHYRKSLRKWGNPGWRVNLHYGLLFTLGRLHMKTGKL